MKTLLLILVLIVGFTTDYLISGTIYTSIVTTLVISFLALLMYLKSTQEPLAVFAAMLLLATMVFIVIALFNVANATECQASVISYQHDQQNDTYALKNWKGIQVDCEVSDGVYVLGSHQTASVYGYRSNLFNYTFNGVGVGKRHSVTDWLDVYGQVALYHVDNDKEGYQDENEGLYYALNLMWYQTHPEQRFVNFDRGYEVTTQEFTVGGTIGTSITLYQTKNSSLEFGYEKTIMSLSQEYAGMSKEWDAYPGARWETKVKEDLGNTGFKLTYSFEF